MNAAPYHRVAPFVLSASAFVLVSTEFVVIGIAPILAAELSLSMTDVGWLVTVFAVASAVLGPPLALLAVRFSPSVVLGCSLLPFAGNLLLAAFPSISLAVGLRVIQGAALPVYMSIASTHLTRTHGAGRGVALLYLGVMIGSTLTPPVGAFIADRLDWRTLMMALGLLATATAVLSATLRIPPLPDRPNIVWRSLVRRRFILHLLLSALIFATMFSGYSYITLLLLHAHLSLDEITLALFVFGVASILGTLLGGRYASQVLKAGSGVVTAIAVSTVVLIELGDTSLNLIFLCLVIWGVAQGAGFVLCQARVMAASIESPSFAGSMNISAGNVGIATGTFLSGCVISALGFEAVTSATVGFAVLAVGVAFVLRRCDWAH